MLTYIQYANESDKKHLDEVKARVATNPKRSAKEIFWAISRGRTLAAEWVIENTSGGVHYTFPATDNPDEKERVSTLERAALDHEINPFKMLLKHRANKNSRTHGDTSSEMLINLCITQVQEEFVAELIYAGAELEIKARCNRYQRGILSGTFNFVSFGYFSPAEQARALAENASPETAKRFNRIADMIETAIVEGPESVKKFVPTVGQYLMEKRRS